MPRRKILQPEDVLHIIKSKGDFQINPLAWRSYGLMKMIRRMLRQGVLHERRVTADDYRYTENKNATVDK